MADKQIHELTAINRNPTGTDVLAIDTGTATYKIPYSQIYGMIADGVMNGVIAPEYTQTQYAVGDYSMHNGHLYRCNTAIPTGEAWNSNHWTQVTLGEDVADVMRTVDAISITVSNHTLAITI